MKIKSVEPFILHVPVTGSRIDGTSPTPTPQAWQQLRQPES